MKQKLSYSDRQKESGFKVGDYVTITRKPFIRGEKGWPCSWPDEMDRFVSDAPCKITFVSHDGIYIKPLNGSIELSDGRPIQDFIFPYYVFQKASGFVTIGDKYFSKEKLRDLINAP